MKKLREILILKNIKGVGKTTIYKKYWELLQNCNDSDDLIAQLLETDNKYSEADIREASKRAEKIIADLEKNSNIHAITVFDEEYPTRLNVMKDKRPLILYAKGNVNSLRGDNIALIGTRKPSDWSRKVEPLLTRKILELTERIVISGLALGCDAIAHETTVEEGKKTVAVLPSGVNVIVPTSHKKLAENILKNDGCLVSEYEPDAKAYKTTFVERDSVVAALSDITLAVECGIKSGTMHTVDAAYEYHRTIGCYYPKDVSRGDYSGNLYMIENKDAKKVSDTEDLDTLFSSKEKIPLIASEEVPEKGKPHQLTFDEIVKNKSN